MLTTILLFAGFTTLVFGVGVEVNTQSHYHYGVLAHLANLADSGDHAAEVDTLCAPWNRGDAPGVAVMVVRNGRILLNKGYGLANLESKTPITSKTVFDFASITKQFTAMAIMMLAERSKLRYDDTLSTFFPEFPAYARKITLRHLLNHTSGLPDYEALFVRAGKVSANWPRSIHEPPDRYEPTAKDALHLLERQPDLLFEPGSRWEYSNSGYVVLGQIVEKVSGERYRDFMQNEIFKLLGMTSTEVYDEQRRQIANRAASYTRDGSTYRNIDYTPVSLVYGEGNIVSTLGDMYRWDQALYGDKLVKQSTLAQAFAPGRLKDGSLTDYGFGWQIRNWKGIPYYEHGGGWLGFRTDIRRYPSLRVTIVIASNLAQANTYALLGKISELYLRDK